MWGLVGNPEDQFSDKEALMYCSVLQDGVIDQLYELLLEHFHVHANSIGFPEVALPSVLQVRDSYF